MKKRGESRRRWGGGEREGGLTMCEVEGVNVKVPSERSAMQVRKKVVRWGLLCRTQACCNARGERPVSLVPEDSGYCV